MAASAWQENSLPNVELLTFAGRQRVFRRIGAIARHIIVVGVDAVEIGNTNCGGSSLRHIARLGCSDGVDAGGGRSCIGDAGSRGTGIG